MVRPVYLNFSLVDAVEQGDVEWARERVALGADPKQVLSTGETLLHKAAYNGSPEMIGFLLESGVDPHVRTERGSTVLSTAAGRLPGADVTEVVRLLIAAGVNVEHGAFGHAALHGAAYSCNVDTARLLLEAGANPDAVSEQGETPLMMALAQARKDDEAQYGGPHLALCELLVRAGASTSHVPKQAAPSYLTPFQTVLSLGWLQWVETFARLGNEDPAQRTLDGRTLLQLAPGQLRQDAKRLLHGLNTERAVASALDESAKGNVSPVPRRGLAPL